MNAVVRIAEGYLAQIISRKGEQFQQESGSRREDKTVGGVINLLEVAGAQQVMLEVKVAEVAQRAVELARVPPGLLDLQTDSTVVADATLLQVIREAGLQLPTLCHLDGLTPVGACRLCLVAIEGHPKLEPACVTTVARSTPFRSAAWAPFRTTAATG